MITIGEDGRHQPNALIRGEGRVDQLLPGGRLARHENTVKLTNGYTARMNEKLTSRGNFARLPKLPGAKKGLRPSNVESIPTMLP